MPRLILLALATFASEDLTCIAAGVLVAQGQLGFLGATLACLAGIFFGDILLFLAGRFFGRPALRLPLLRRCISPAQLERASAWLSARGGSAILISRFVPGLRLPTYFAAGLLKTNFWKFSLFFLFAAAVWTPLLVGSTALIGGPAVEEGVRGAAVVAACGIAVRRLLSFRSRRGLIGALKRIARWEFWPPWGAYLPLVPYLAWLALRHRSLTLFTAANPGMEYGGFVGESKSAILANLDPRDVAAYTVIPAALAPAARIRKALSFVQQFPVVLKPDVGQRGAGVAIVRSQPELEAYLSGGSGDTIVQKYVSGVEYGVFYCRFPGAAAGRILSITEKRFPEVAGDGSSTIEELILRDRRAVCLASMYLKRLNGSAVPAAGERVALAELGSHCRGAVFLDAGQLATPALAAEIDRISRAHPGFYFGRFDLRAASADSFVQGRSLAILELNGAGAEATHIYDPAVSLLEAYRVLFRHWRLAFEIGAMNRRRGAQPARLRELVAAIRPRPKETYARAVEVLD